MSILNKFIFSKCSICDKRTNAFSDLCANCNEKIDNFARNRKCVICNRPVFNENELICHFCDKLEPDFDQAIAVYNYEDEFKKALVSYKFNRHFYRVRLFSKLLLKQYEKLNVKCDCIIPVPTSYKNILERRYCTTVELAHVMNFKLKIKCYPKALVKMNNRQQSLLKIEDRYDNVKDLFDVDVLYRNKIKGKNILLVDDVITTGSTASECSRLLKYYGAKEVYAVALLYGGGN